MALPFTREQFFGVFSQFNQSFWPVAALFWVAAVITVVAAASGRLRIGRRVSILLALLWAWNAVGYHALLFTRINPAAWVFAALFAVEALLFAWAAARCVEYFSSPRPMRAVGIGLTCYALAYPFLNLALGHAYPASPTFGVPCPTVILTIGLLLTASGTVPAILMIVPALWGYVGGSAAVLLGVKADYVLLAAGVLMSAVVLVRLARPRLLRDARPDHSAASNTRKY